MSAPSIQNRQLDENGWVSRGSYGSIAELQQVRQTVSEASLEIIQLERGAIRGELVNVSLEHSSVHSNSFSLSARGRGTAPSARWSCVLVSEKVVGTFNCEPLDPDKVVLYRPRAEFDGTTFGPFHNWALMADDASLRQAVQCLFGADLPSVSESCWTVRPEPEQLARLRRTAKTLLALGIGSPDILTDPRVHRFLDRTLVEQLARLVATERVREPKSPRRAAVSYTRIVRLAEDYVASRPDEPVTVSELCEQTKVSERTLRNAFHSVLGISPNAYLKVRRLHRARALLEQAASRPTTVTSAAVSCGFFHLGHFARDYRTFFGESPSETLARARGNRRAG